MTSQPTRRERKKLQTRAALIAAGVRLFAERGFAGTTIEDITEAADTSPRTFFRYFPSKEDLLVADMPEAIRLVRQELAATNADEPVLHAARRVAIALVRTFTRPEALVQRRLILSIPEVRRRMIENHERIDQALLEEIAARLGVDPELDLRPRVASSVALGAVRAAVHAWVATDGRADPAEVVERTFDLLDGGLRSFGTFAPSSGRRE